MIELGNEQYKKLVKDADDNVAAVRITRTIAAAIVFVIIFAIFMVSYGCHSMDMRKRIDVAETNKQVREIESEGLEYDQYIEWLEARKGE